MRTRALLTTVLAAVAAVPGFAHAAPPDDAAYTGGCFVAAARNSTQLLDPPSRWRGVLGGAVAGSSPTLGHNPVQTYLSCHIRVNGTVVASAAAPSGAATVTAQPVMFTASDTDDVQVCEEVGTWDAHGQRKAWYACHETVMGTVAPDAVVDLVCSVSGDPVCAIADANRVQWVTGGWP